MSYFEDKNILVTGGTGFLGQSFLYYINEGKLKIKLYKIIIVSRKKKKSRIISLKCDKGALSLV